MNAELKTLIEEIMHLSQKAETQRVLLAKKMISSDTSENDWHSYNAFALVQQKLSAIAKKYAKDAK